MANLGSEVSRILSSREAGDVAFEQGSMGRAERILADIKRLPDMRTRIPELNTLSQAIKEPEISPEHLRSYFEPFISRLVAS